MQGWSGAHRPGVVHGLSSLEGEDLQFYADIEGHPDDRNVRLALEELDYFTSEVKLLGVYPADPRRR